MTRLKKGDICPCCGEPIKKSDPFTLGYLSALHDMISGDQSPADQGPEASEAVTEEQLFCRYLSAGWDDCMDFNEYRSRFIESGGKIVEVQDGQADRS